jgi:hypothetical protein
LERLVIKGNGFNILMLGEKLGTERQWCRVVTQRGLEMSGERGASEDKYRGKKRVYVG